MGEKHKEENVKSESKETLYTEILEININRLYIQYADNK